MSNTQKPFHKKGLIKHGPLWFSHSRVVILMLSRPKEDIGEDIWLKLNALSHLEEKFLDVPVPSCGPRHHKSTFHDRKI